MIGVYNVLRVFNKELNFKILIFLLIFIIIFDDVIQHDSDVISIKSLLGWIDFGLFFHMQLSIFDMHVPITHSERHLNP